MVRPTVFVSVPHLFNRIYEGIWTKFKKASFTQRVFIDNGLITKLENLQTTGSYVHCFYDRLVFSKVKAAMGGRLRLMINGSAPLLPHVHSFLKVVMSCPMLEGYGQTETTGAAFATVAHDPTTGHVGGPLVSQLLFSAQSNSNWKTSRSCTTTITMLMSRANPAPAGRSACAEQASSLVTTVINRKRRRASIRTGGFIPAMLVVCCPTEHLG